LPSLANDCHYGSDEAPISQSGTDVALSGGQLGNKAAKNTKY